MIINHTYKFVFIHVPKAAGTTVTRTLSEMSRYCDQEIGRSGIGQGLNAHYAKRFGLRKHSRAEQVMMVMGKDDFLSYFRFAFVRNPYNRLASAYHFLKAWKGLPDRFRSELDAHVDFESFLESDLWTSAFPGRGPDSIFQPQTRWLFTAGKQPEQLVEFIGKTEDLTQDLATILGKIGTSIVPATTQVHHANKSPTYNLPKYWKPDVVDRIQKEYRRDFKLLGYSQDPPESISARNK